jgi:curli biogenesis system outer membrane secretion channel CsgG
MRIIRNFVAATALASMAAGPIAASAQTSMPSKGQTYRDGTTKGASSGRREQERGQREIPRCTRSLGTVAIVEPENKWWREMQLGSPEAILKVFIQQSGCFTIVNRGRAMQSRAMERALQEQGEMQGGQNIGKGQVRTADYFLEPDIVSTNKDSGGGGIGAVAGMFGRRLGGIGAIAGSINIKKKEASVTLSIVDARTTEEKALTEGYARKTDVGFGAGGGGGWWGGFAAAGGQGYQNTEIGQVIVLAYLDAFTKLVDQLGGLPDDAAAAAPPARR